MTNMYNKGVQLKHHGVLTGSGRVSVTVSGNILIKFLRGIKQVWLQLSLHIEYIFSTKTTPVKLKIEKLYVF